jgi:hypothetical protein
MSPALLDTGTPIQNPNSNINITNGQLSRSSLGISLLLLFSFKKFSIKTRNQHEPIKF